MLNTNIKLGGNPNSVSIRFQKGSDMEGRVFPSNGSTAYIRQYHWRDEETNYNKYKETDGRVEVIVLQVLIFGEAQYLVEVLETKHLKEEL